MKRIVRYLIVVALLLAAWYVARPRVLWLDYFEGTITDRYERPVPTVREGRKTQELSEYYWQVLTQDARRLEVEVPQDRYFRSRIGMKVKKAPFTVEVELIER
jgi:hypothetical protein